MRRHALIALAMGLATPAAAAIPDLTPLLTFEGPAPNPATLGWGGGPPATLFADSLVAHGGRRSGRLERAAESPGGFSTFTAWVPADFSGQTLELRGWLRTQDVTGWVGLWLREDAPSGAVQFENMQQRQLTGTTPWTEYTVTLPLDARARQIFFGALLAGTGLAWVDDLQLLIDGRPVEEAAAAARAATPLETDHEFDGDSRVAISALSGVQVDNLAMLGKVWGFLKYHHPAVTRGTRHWDYDLFRVMPGVLKAMGRDQAQAHLVSWLDELGVPTGCDPCAGVPDQLHLQPELQWLQDVGLLGPTLASRLQTVHRFREQHDRQFYVDFVPGVGNPDFATELSYRHLSAPDAGYRVLALFRFWNQVAYWFPYRDQIEEDWDAVLSEFLPRLVAADDLDAYKLELIALIARIHDTHANLWRSLDVRPPRGDAALPVVLRFVGDEAVVVGYHDAALGAASGLQIADVIERIDQQPVAGLVEAWMPWYAGSNLAVRRRDMASGLTRGPAGPCELTIRRQDAQLSLTAQRVALDNTGFKRIRTHDRPGDTFQRLPAGIGYLKLSTVKTEEIPAYLQAVEGARGLVIDIRNYPSAFMVFDLTGHFITAPVPFVRFTRGDPENPGAFSWTPPLVIQPLQPHYAGRVVVLVDEMTQSSAEYTAMAMRAAGATVIGSTTAGADGNVSKISLPGGLEAMFSGIGVFYPDKTPTQRVGIVPDQVVTPTVAGIRDGRDEVLDAALSELLGDGSN